MPGLNQTGPMGQGPMTGRRMGRCSNYGAKTEKEETASSENQKADHGNNFPGRGFGFGWRAGRGRGGKGMGFRNRNRGGL